MIPNWPNLFDNRVIMSAFTKFAWIRPLIESNLRELDDDLTYDVFYEWSWYTVVVPKWFIFDWASVPEQLWRAIQKVEPKTILWACLHDRWYWDGRDQITILFDRAKKDWIISNDMKMRYFVDWFIFYEPMIITNCNKYKAIIMRLWVHLFWWPIRSKSVKI